MTLLFLQQQEIDRNDSLQTLKNAQSQAGLVKGVPTHGMGVWDHIPS